MRPPEEVMPGVPLSHIRAGPNTVEGAAVPADQVEDLAPPPGDPDIAEDPYMLLPPMGMMRNVPLDDEPEDLEDDPEEMGGPDGEEATAMLDDGQKSMNRSTYV